MENKETKVQSPLKVTFLLHLFYSSLRLHYQHCTEKLSFEWLSALPDAECSLLEIMAPELANELICVKHCCGIHTDDWTIE